MVYNAKVISDGGQTVQTYIGCSQNFADRYYKHRSDFMNPKTKHATTLSTYVWELKDQGKDFDISWKIIDRGPLFNHASKRCRLCIKESFYILYKPELATLNRRNEVFHVCHHRLTQTLRNLKWSSYIYVWSCSSNGCSSNVSVTFFNPLLISFTDLTLVVMYHNV